MVARVVLGVWEKTGQQLLEITRDSRGAALQRLLLVVIVEEGVVVQAEVVVVLKLLQVVG